MVLIFKLTLSYGTYMLEDKSYKDLVQQCEDDIIENDEQDFKKTNQN